MKENTMAHTRKIPTKKLDTHKGYLVFVITYCH